MTIAEMEEAIHRLTVERDEARLGLGNPGYTDPAVTAELVMLRNQLAAANEKVASQAVTIANLQAADTAAAEAAIQSQDRIAAMEAELESLKTPATPETPVEPATTSDKKSGK